MTTHGLELGSLDLASGLVHEDGYTLSVLAENASFGAPEAAVREIVSMLADGNLVSYDRAGNRQASFDVLIEGADGVALQAGEVALRRELYRRNTVTWTPPGDFGPATVYEVLASEMVQSFDDLDEIRTRRKFGVTLTCSPFARSADLVTVAALAPPPVTPTTVVLTNADTTTGWFGSYQSTPPPVGPATVAGVAAVDSGSYVTITATGYFLKLFGTFTRTAVALGVSRYVVVEVSWVGTGLISPNFQMTINGTTGYYTPILTRATTSGTALYVLDTVTGGSFTSLVVSGQFATSPLGQQQTASLSVHDVTATDTLPQVSARQITRILPGRGTERTPGSIHVSGPTDLGITAVHTSPADGSGYSPPLRRWRVAGGSTVNTTDPGPFSGARELISPSFHAKVPTSALPEGGYQMIAILRCPTTTTVPVYWDLWTIPPGATTDAERQGNIQGGKSVSFTANVWAMVVLAEDVSLPTLRTKAGQVEVFVGAGSGVELDEVWLFRTDDDCALSYVNVTETNLWLDSPNSSSPVPTVWIGETRANSTHPGTKLAGMGAHILHPDGTTLFTATSGVNSPAASAEFYPRWHSNAAE